MITRRSMFGLALLPWAPKRKGITRKDVELLLAIIKQAIANGEAASAR